MLPNKLTGILLTGATAKGVLIKIALHWAQLGDTVWYISKQRITELPVEFVQNVDKEALKLLILLYIPEMKNVAARLNEIHLWNKIPRIVIVEDIDHYWKTLGESEWINTAAYFCALLLDATAVYSNKRKKNTFLIVSTTQNENSKISLIQELYFPNVVNIAEMKSNAFEKILKIFSDIQNAE